ncbi:carboxypeptidase regulatory-like domain-containing protein [Sanguibacter massiliensis]|uniref:carboxypeptidase regulatory-like domain-containing protein n=1 Tax=Sanguibacter massiliensis TaxID=1973217 RepID=UPI000C82DAA2|nr:carboxypeptidase regulatory-like domain-containing protein [Sanguibacter massiliensis]
MLKRHGCAALVATIALALTGGTTAAAAGIAPQSALTASPITTLATEVITDVPVTVSGQLIDDAGEPAFGYVELYVVDAEDGLWSVADAQTGDDGAFEIDLPDEGDEFTLRAAASGYRATWLGDVDDSNDARTFTRDEVDSLDATIRMISQTSLSGRVTFEGDDLESGVVYLYGWDGDAWQVESTSEVYDGTYNFGEVSLGTYTLAYRTHDDSTVSSFYGGGSSLPQVPDASNSIVTTPGLTTADLEVTGLISIEGTVTSPQGPVGGASIRVYKWSEEGNEWWHSDLRAQTDDAGRYRLLVMQGDTETFTLRVTRARYAVGFLGGGTSFSEPTPSNSFTAATAATLPNIVLTPRASSLGRHAGVIAPHCTTHELLPNDDESTDAIQLPFNLTYFGQPYSEIYVNNNGNVTFDGPLSQYTPEALDGDLSKPIIAPFFADVDTRDTEESDVVTYGASPDGKSFCVNWDNVEPFFGTSSSGALNTFQLILTSREDVPGRSAGDFDITFNYDEITWDTGSASGDIAATVGYASGTGDDGTFFQLDGSLTSGAFFDSGSHALIAGRQNSTVSGRYVYEIRNLGHDTLLGGVTGTVLNADGSPAADVFVELSNGRQAYTTRTSANGTYSVAAARVGEYSIRAWPIDDGVRQAGARVTVVAGETVTVPDVQFAQPVGMPTNVGLSGASTGTATAGSVPSIYYQDALALSYTAAPGGTATFEVLGIDGSVLTSGTFVESQPGVYQATVPALYPHVGDAEVRITFTPASGVPTVTEFAIYIDPSGTVVDSWGMPIAGATTTLLRADDYNTEYTVVPDGSDLMSAKNRTNPMSTSAQGIFGWDVQPGWYKVRAEKPGYTSATTQALEVPPERVDLVIKLAGGSAPTLTSTLSGSATVGSQLTVTGPTLDSKFKVTGYRWLRNGAAIPGATGASYTLTADDAGATVGVSTVIQREAVRFDPLDSSVLVSFAPFEAPAPAVQVPAAPVVTPPSGETTTPPTTAAFVKGKVAITGAARVGNVLKVKRTGWSGSASYSYQWLRNGKAIGKATKTNYRLTSADLGKRITVRVTAKPAAAARVSVTSKATAKVAKGKGTIKVKVSSKKAGVATLKVTVTRAGVAAKKLGGKVTVRDGKRVVGTHKLKNGKATITLKKLTKGKHTLTVSYPATKTHVALKVSVKQSVR